MPSSSPSTDRPSSSGHVFQADSASGILVRPDGKRCSALAIDFISSLQTSLSEQFGEDAQDVLYRCGFEWGLQELAAYGSQLQRESTAKTVTLVEMQPQFVLEGWWRTMRAAGHGSAAFDCTREARGILVIDVVDSAMAQTSPRGNQPVCHYYAGLFAGAASFLDRAERHATEVQCRSLGHTLCQFVVGPGSDVDAAEAARRTRTAAVEIIRRLG